ncbi:hypothetical protein Bwad002_26670 [Bilophila wadsworthia]
MRRADRPVECREKDDAKGSFAHGRFLCEITGGKKKSPEKGAFFLLPNPHPSPSQTVRLVDEAVWREFVAAEEESLPFEENA